MSVILAVKRFLANGVEIPVDSNGDLNIPVSEGDGGGGGGTSDLMLGETASTAYRGDRGLTAYQHSQSPHAPADAQKNIKPDWQSASADPSGILNRPNQVNFNIYNQNNSNKITVSDTSKKSIITATVGAKNIPTYQLNDSFIGKVYGTFDASSTARIIQVFFTIGNRETSVTLNMVRSSTLIPFEINYTINFPVARDASITGVITCGSDSVPIDLGLLIITGLNFDINATLSGGVLTINSSYLHRNYN